MPGFNNLSDLVDSAEQTTQLQPLIIIEFVNTSTAAFRKDTENEVVTLGKSLAIQENKRGYHRYLLRSQVKQVSMLIKDSLFGPSPRPIKFHYHPVLIHSFNFKDPVDITV
jgi:hypothetical protein